MRTVPVKTVDQQAALMLAGSRERLVRLRTQLANTIRGLAAEFGLVAPTGTAQIGPLLARIAADVTLPALVRDAFAGLATDYERVQTRIAEADAKLRAWHRQSEASQRLAKVPGIGPVIASLLVMKTPDPGAFRSGRDVAAIAKRSAGSRTAKPHPAWLHAPGPRDRGQNAIGADHPGGRRNSAQPAGGGGDRGGLDDTLGHGPAADALAGQAARAQAGEAGRGGVGQQDGADCLDAAGQRRGV